MTRDRIGHRKDRIQSAAYFSRREGEWNAGDKKKRDGFAGNRGLSEPDRKNKRIKYCRRKRRARKKAYMLKIALTFIAVMFLALGGGKVWSFSEESLPKDGERAPGNGQPTVELRQLYSPNAVLTDADSGEILAELKGKVRIYPASLTKIMTAYIAAEQTEDLDGSIEIPSDFFSELYEENASMAGFLPGEQAGLRDLLYGILLPSGAECCLAFAERIAGSEEAFVKLMNEKAKELGMKDTHFCNATGLHDPEHYSTAEDMAALLREALKNPEFKEAFTSRSRSVPPSDMHSEGFTFTSTMFQYLESGEVAGGEILGGKTGYTPEAGLCLASLAQVNGKEYILVTANAEGSHATEQFHILDAANVYNQIGKGQTL